MLIADRLAGLLAAHLEIDPVALRGGTRLGSDLGVDSLAAIELGMAVEDEFDISLPDDVLGGLTTYADLLAAVAGRLPAGVR